ncbi:MAG: hypothetical protein UW88_C0001G0118 [Candidatus Collierbacteria bacterium GW2011_GWD2_45_10]|nr:MAG: hypothetical protein UW56_C0009G0045 [Candidatus Collierbacteria bacterium GW2011_GWD1_44_27]KKT89738.1 MAG: hypothetical protein UW88_C0001G0118 [Candidatus Collierbacteria bacterium GW2011_GWD2_45_10]
MEAKITLDETLLIEVPTGPSAPLRIDLSYSMLSVHSVVRLVRFPLGQMVEKKSFAVSVLRIMAEVQESLALETPDDLRCMISSCFGPLVTNVGKVAKFHSGQPMESLFFAVIVFLFLRMTADDRQWVVRFPSLFPQLRIAMLI